MKRVAIIGYGMTRFGTHWDKSFVDLAKEAGSAALRSAGAEPKDVQALYTGTMSSALFNNQEHVASIMAAGLGLSRHHVPSTRVEAACASGSAALRQAYMDIASGQSSATMALGFEKMTDVSTAMATRALAAAGSYDHEAYFGATFPALYAMIARLHMHRYKTTEEQLAMCSVKSHANAVHNEYAQFRKPVTVEQVMHSARIADPLKLLDCSPISDGAAAVVLASEETAKKFTDEPVWIDASAQASDCISLHDREDICTLKASVVAARKALQQAKLELASIGCVEVHDCFSIAEVLAIEDIGFCGKGEGGRFVEDGNTEIGGKIPVNTSGGLKAKGHPIGASGISQAIEAAEQLLGRAGRRGVNARYAMTHNVGGTGGTAAVHIFSREARREA